MGSKVFWQGFVPKTGRAELELLAAGSHGGQSTCFLYPEFCPGVSCGMHRCMLM